MSANKIRFKIETSILAEALCVDGAFQEMSIWLKPNNFILGEKVQGLPFHRFLWTSMMEMYPLQPINMVSVGYYLCKKHNEKKALEINAITDGLMPLLNRPHHCLILLELDLRKSLLSLIDGFITNQNEYKTKLDLLEIETFVKNEKVDIFDALDTLGKFFEAGDNFVFEREKLKDFKSKIDIRVDDIRRMAHFKSLMSNFDRMYNFPTNKNLELNCLIDIIKIVIISNELKSEYSDQLFNIRAKISA